jgi:hypothetical protein
MCFFELYESADRRLGSYWILMDVQSIGFQWIVSTVSFWVIGPMILGKRDGKWGKILTNEWFEPTTSRKTGKDRNRRAPTWGCNFDATDDPFSPPPRWPCNSVMTAKRLCSLVQHANSKYFLLTNCVGLIHAQLVIEINLWKYHVFGNLCFWAVFAECRLACLAHVTVT